MRKKISYLIFERQLVERIVIEKRCLVFSIWFTTKVEKYFIHLNLFLSK